MIKIITIFTIFILLSLCLTNNFKIKKNKDGERRLIQFSPSLKLWLTHKQIDELGKHGDINFMDITDIQVIPKTKLKDTGPFPSELRYQSIVNPLTKEAKIDNLKKTIEDMSSYFNRYYTTEDGEKASHYLLNECKSIVNGLPPSRKSLFQVKFFNHSFGRQPSVIVSMKGQNSAVQNQIVVVGGHLDSTAGGALRKAPGADDDASGSAVVLEIFRIIAQSSYVPDRSIEFMFYAAEEVGLRGSGDIATNYRIESKSVHAVVQFDMVAFVTRRTVGIITDFVSRDLNQFLKLCITGYSALSYGETRCGYACSDHASWTRNGYRAVFPFEAYPFSNLNRRIHTANDLLQYIDLNNAVEYAKFGLGFAIELSKL